MDKFVATFEGKSFTEEGEQRITLSTSNRVNLEKGKTYHISLSEKKPPRSLRQNALMWEMIHQIAMAEDGNLKDVENIYCQCLQESGAKYTYLEGEKRAIESLKNTEGIRAVKVIKEAVINHKVYQSVQVFTGSSKFNTAEMATLIDYVLKRASENGIETEYYRGLLYD